LPPMATGEIGNLTQVFSHMLDSIHEREAALQNLNYSLEARIAARTEELRLANHKLQELDRRKSLFVSTASHEIKTPLTSITCHLDNLLMGVDGPLLKEQTKVLERVQANIGRLQHLLVDLLDLCKIELGEAAVDLQPINARTAVTQAIEGLQSFASRRGVFIDMAIPSTLPLVTADAAKLHQIATNLLHNALKFSPEYSTVRITGETFSDGFARIAVQDAGCGIAPDETEKIFEPFYRSKQVSTQTRGTGLGLSIAKQLVELHHGRLWVESEKGQGACFFFTLPIWAHADSNETHHDEPVLLSN
ncbi:MAG: HAMP domain-containing histidine kinase, partial [Nitrospira sp.]|nr:HAMP domain-containing histidine kinase [Nitrospira sp.]